MKRETYSTAFPFPEVHILLHWNDILRVIGVGATTGFGVADCSLLRG